MELTADLIAIQGILTSKIKQTGEFTKINYKGGNEDKILDIMLEMQKYFMSKNYVKDKKVNKSFNKELEDIVFFLAINTVYKKPLVLEEYAHLMDIIPPLSKCLFANVVYGLDLCPYFCSVIEKLPLQNGTELLDEAIQCLKKSIPKIHLEFTSMFLRSAARKLENTEYLTQNKEDIEDFTGVTNIMLLNLTGIYSDQSRNMEQLQIYQHMGYCLLNLFDLLLMCKKDHLSNKQFIYNIMTTCCSIVRNVTINVFCAWAEIDEDGENLQRLVSEKAYLIIETFYKINEASELISMLGAIAKKPLSIAELIQNSDASTIIKMINKKDNNQEKWFRALFTTQVFKNKEALRCIDKWAHLCNDDDVTLLLNLSIQTNDQNFRKLVIKCASCLSMENLITVCTRHFYRNKFSHILNENIQSSVTLIFNKLLENQPLLDDIGKEIILLFLQNPLNALTVINSECTKNKFYTDCMVGVFEKIKEISRIDNIGIQSLRDVLTTDTVEYENSKNYAYLLKQLHEIEYLTTEDIILKIILPILKQFNEERRLDELINILQIVQDVNVSIPVRDQYREFLEICLQLMKYRCKFLNYDNKNQEIVECIVYIFCELCDINVNSDFQVSAANTEEDCYLSYYSKYISSDMKTPFFISLCPDFDINNYGHCVAQILQILPSAVIREWLDISEEIIKAHGSVKFLELFTDVIILLAELVKTQNIDDNKCVYLALSSCLRNFGVIIQEKIQKDSTTEIEEMVATQICRILAKLPESVKEQEGIILLNVLNEQYLKSLASNKEFLCLVILIKNSKLCKAIIEKIK